VIDPERQRRVEDLCDAALSRDARVRTAFVAAACGDDKALQQEVNARLRRGSSRPRLERWRRASWSKILTGHHRAP
jgi:hypothetical protein